MTHTILNLIDENIIKIKYAVKNNKYKKKKKNKFLLFLIFITSSQIIKLRKVFINSGFTIQRQFLFQ